MRVGRLQCRFHGRDAAGWTWLLAYWSKRPQLDFRTIPPRSLSRDAALCPEHACALEEQLKGPGRELLGPTMGEA
jgi:hypothetical protein